MTKEELKEKRNRTIESLNDIKEILGLDELYIDELENELEKEIAKRNEELKDANEKVVHLACNQNKDLKRKINKAKELLNEFLDFESSCMERGIYISDKTRTEVEQFLSEVDK